jgi:hypothetical protein
MDPYDLRGALKSDADLEVIRKSGPHGKAIEAYHKRQNEVERNLRGCNVS